MLGLGSGLGLGLGLVLGQGSRSYLCSSAVLLVPNNLHEVLVDARLHGRHIDV